MASPSDIYRRLRGVVADVDARIQAGEKAFPIGVLSADDRDIWAKVKYHTCSSSPLTQRILSPQNLTHLLSLSQTNKSSHETLLTSVMALSLDHTAYNLLPTSSVLHPRSETQSSLDAHLHSIRATPINVSNRFFDKPYTVLVDPLARAGATGEHSPCDALVPSIVAEYAIVQGVEEEAFASPETEEIPATTGGENSFTRINWVADKKLWCECQEAKRRSLALIEDSDDSVFWFDEYGTDWIKGVGTSCLSAGPSPNSPVVSSPSQFLTRRLHPDGTPACMVQNPRRVHGDI